MHRRFFINRNFLLLWVGVVSELDANTLALTVSAIIVLVGGALMLYNLGRPASLVETTETTQR